LIVNVIEQSPISKLRVERRAMFFGPNNMARRLSSLLYRAGDLGLVNNDFLSYLTPVIHGRKPSFVAGNFRSKGPLASNRLTDGWKQMLVSEHREVRKFAEDLVYYAYITSGNRRSIYTLQDLIPVEYLHEAGVSEFVHKMADTILQSDMLVPMFSANALLNEYRTNLLPFVPAKQIVKQKKTEKTTYFQVHADFAQAPAPKRRKKEDIEIVPMFRSSVQGEIVLMLHQPDYGKTGEVWYAAVNKKGYHDAGFHIYEYTDETSIIEQNNQYADYFDMVPTETEFGDYMEQLPAPDTNVFDQDASDQAKQDRRNRNDSDIC
jgi:hypothetical protein